MSYLALYRQYRPRTFDEVKGQDAIIHILKNQVREKQPSHAYLFCGPRGTGKTSTAKILAKAVNCLHPTEDGNPCLQCKNCIEAASDSAVDIIEIDAASNNSVDNIRDIREKVNLLPANSQYKVYIIDEVHMLSTGAFNALLKTLEEPPAHVIFILATTEVRRLPATILSRCQRYDFKRMSSQVIVDNLQKILEEKQIPFEMEALAEIASLSGGAMRDALSILDKVCVGAQSITKADVLEALGSADQGQMIGLFEKIAQGDAKSALEMVEQMFYRGLDAASITKDLMAVLKEMLLLSVGGTGEEPLQRVANALGSQIIVRDIELLSDAAYQMKFSDNGQVLLEMTLVKMVLPYTDEKNENAQAKLFALEKKLEQAEARIEELAKSASAPPVMRQETAEQKSIPNTRAVQRPLEQSQQKEREVVEGVQGSDLAVKPLWEKVVAYMKQNERHLALHVGLLVPVKVADHVIHLKAPQNSISGEMVMQEENRQVVEKALQEITGKPMRIQLLKRAHTSGKPDQESMTGLFGMDDVEIID